MPRQIRLRRTEAVKDTLEAIFGTTAYPFRVGEEMVMWVLWYNKRKLAFSPSGAFYGCGPNPKNFSLREAEASRQQIDELVHRADTAFYATARSVPPAHHDKATTELVSLSKPPAPTRKRAKQGGRSGDRDWYLD